jgi:hypothetical protein
MRHRFRRGGDELSDTGEYVVSIEIHAEQPSTAFASCRSPSRGPMKKDSGGQAIEGWLSRMSRSRVVPDRCTPITKVGESHFTRLSEGTMMRWVHRVSQTTALNKLWMLRSSPLANSITREPRARSSRRAPAHERLDEIAARPEAAGMRLSKGSELQG